jgi:hypothetical protein
MPKDPAETTEEASKTVDMISNGKRNCGRKKKKYNASGIKIIPSIVGMTPSIKVFHGRQMLAVSESSDSA